MGVFNKFDKQTSQQSNITTISIGAGIHGELDLQCDLHIDGLVEGSIISNATVKIGKTGIVHGEISAIHLIVSGKLKGDARCESIQILEGGEVQGDLYTNSLSIDFNSTFLGKSIKLEQQPDNHQKDIDAENETKVSLLQTPNVTGTDA